MAQTSYLRLSGRWTFAYSRRLSFPKESHNIYRHPASDPVLVLSALQQLGQRATGRQLNPRLSSFRSAKLGRTNFTDLISSILLRLFFLVFVMHVLVTPGSIHPFGCYSVPVKVG